MCMPIFEELPPDIKNYYDNMYGSFGINDIAQYVADMSAAWPVYLIIIGTCIVIT